MSLGKNCIDYDQGGSTVTAETTTEQLTNETDFINILNAIQSKKPRPYVFNDNPIKSCVKAQKKIFIADVFALSI